MHYTNYTTPQLQLHYTTTTTAPCSCTTPHYIQQLWVRWPLQPVQPLQQTQIQPPFGQWVDSLCHPWFTTTSLSYRFPILKLPPPPCAVLLAYWLMIVNNGLRFTDVSIIFARRSARKVVAAGSDVLSPVWWQCWRHRELPLAGAKLRGLWNSLVCLVPWGAPPIPMEHHHSHTFSPSDGDFIWYHIILIWG